MSLWAAPIFLPTFPPFCILCLPAIPPAKKNQMKTFSITARIAAAAELGRNAFHSGLMRAPAADKNVMPLIADIPPGTGQSIPVLTAWLNAWDAENLA